jgi:hypothetical protein
MDTRLLLTSPIVFGLAFGISAEPRETILDLIDMTLSDTFESGELNAWESYPIAEIPDSIPKSLVTEPAYQEAPGLSPRS